MNQENPTLSQQVGRKIRALRFEMQATQEEIAKRLDISVPALSKIETGITDINLSRLHQIAELFEVKIDHLINFDLVRPEHEIELLERQHLVEKTAWQEELLTLYREKQKVNE